MVVGSAVCCGVEALGTVFPILLVLVGRRQAICKAPPPSTSIEYPSAGVVFWYPGDGMVQMRRKPTMTVMVIMIILIDDEEDEDDDDADGERVMKTTYVKGMGSQVHFGGSPSLSSRQIGKEGIRDMYFFELHHQRS